jgi:uncharacterized protein (DUF983 family)
MAFARAIAALRIWRRPCGSRSGDYLHDMPHEDPSAPLPIGRGLACRCPRCGKGKLFNGFLTLAPRCERCGLDYSFADAGDGPAIFVILIAGFIVVGAALMVEMLYEPPYWVHAVLWGPLILITTLWPLRAMKGLLIALQYHHQAAEGRPGGPPP